MPLKEFDFNNSKFIVRIYVHFKVLYYLPLVKTGYGLQNVKRLKETRNLSKYHQEPTRNQPEPRQNRPGHEQSAALINFSMSFFIYLASGNQEGREYAIFQTSTFVRYNFQQTVQVIVMLWKCHNK